MATVITANRLCDGTVVFLDSAHAWVTSIGAAAVHAAGADGEAIARARQDEADQLVVEPYAIDVIEKDGAVVPKALREAIRARGPTVRPDLSRAEGTSHVPV